MGSFSVGGERQWSVTSSQWPVKAVGKGEDGRLEGRKGGR